MWYYQLNNLIITAVNTLIICLNLWTFYYVFFLQQTMQAKHNFSADVRLWEVRIMRTKFGLVNISISEVSLPWVRSWTINLWLLISNNDKNAWIMNCVSFYTLSICLSVSFIKALGVKSQLMATDLSVHCSTEDVLDAFNLKPVHFIPFKHHTQRDKPL